MGGTFGAEGKVQLALGLPSLQMSAESEEVGRHGLTARDCKLLRGAFKDSRDQGGNQLIYSSRKSFLSRFVNRSLHRRSDSFR